MKWFGTILFLISTDCNAADYLPLNSSATGQEIARAYRVDSQPAAKARGDSDKRECFLDPTAISSADVARIKMLAQKNKAAAEIEAIKAIRGCLLKKGWRLEVNRLLRDSLSPRVERGQLELLMRVSAPLQADAPKRRGTLMRRTEFEAD